ncbi:LOW QUALITY PROTEIN: hsc70-interacting protein 1-like [Colletes gigas]|uniref:LOW QUALITY PROTEIN: hsc70-interacting protein 1-like n=1 Tax=Colletes gigas TaxID=935657 RepID=UPI001C9B4E41|nr:LOW QUALITY PROTEIN: hsc70-interacting protein 1-like [Colletes gigas]
MQMNHRAKKSENTEGFKTSEAESKLELESDESDLELDMSGVIKLDADAPQKMGNLTLQLPVKKVAESQTKRSKAVSAFAEKDYEKAIILCTEAIVLNPQASLLYAERGQVFLLLNRPNACIVEAASDLRLACKFDFDEQTDEWLHEVTPNARKIEEHKRKKDRKTNEKLERDKLKKAQRNAKAIERIFIDQFRECIVVPPSQTTKDCFKSLDDADVSEIYTGSGSNGYAQRNRCESNELQVWKSSETTGAY